MAAAVNPESMTGVPPSSERGKSSFFEGISGLGRLFETQSGENNRQMYGELAKILLEAVARGGTSWFVQEKVPFGKTATSLALYYGAVKDFVGALFAGSSVERIGKLAAAGLEWKAARSDNTAFRAAAVAGSGAIKDVVEKVFVGTGGGK